MNEPHICSRCTELNALQSVLVDKICAAIQEAIDQSADADMEFSLCMQAACTATSILAKATQEMDEYELHEPVPPLVACLACVHAAMTPGEVGLKDAMASARQTVLAMAKAGIMVPS